MISNEDCFILGGVSLIDIRRIETPNEGFLQFFESGENKDIPFEIKRVYYITEVDKGITRGGHAHKTLKQMLFCPYGCITLILDDGKNKVSVDLDRPNIAIMIEEPVWREMRWNVDGSVLCVVASDYYYEEDYIRDYNAFLGFKEKQY